MYSNPTNTTTTPVATKWEELILTSKPDPVKLREMGVKLDLLLLALKTLAAIGMDALGRVASQLQLESAVADKLTQIGVVCGEVEKTDSFSSPRPSLPEEEGRERKIDEGRSLVLIICHLARQHQSLIRRAVALMEQSASENSDTPTLLRDYSDRFDEVYRRYGETTRRTETDETSVLRAREKLAFKLIIDLLFYSDSGAHRRLWLTLFPGNGSGKRELTSDN